MLDNNFLSSLLTNMNGSQQPEFSWGIGATAPTGLPQRLTRRAQLKIIDVERACVLLLAELAGLRVDLDIGRGEIPSRQGNGFAVRMTAEIPEADPDIRTFELLCFGKNKQRDAVTEPLSRLIGKLPLRGAVTIASRVISTPVTIGELTVIGRCEIARSADSGQEKLLGTVTLRATVVISGRAPVSAG